MYNFLYIVFTILFTFFVMNYITTILKSNLHYLHDTFSSESKEWINNIYYFNSNNLKNIPVYNININKLVKGYFDLFFCQSAMGHGDINLKRLSLNKIFTSDVEIKHTSHKAIITLYVYNRERIVLLQKLINLKESLINIVSFRTKTTAFNLYKELLFIRKCKLRFDLNQLKFKDFFLFKLVNILNFNVSKKIEFNIINLKSITSNSNILTEILKIKLKNKNSNVLRILNYITSLLPNDTIRGQESNLIFENIKYKNIGGLRLEVKGRLTRRYRADRAIFKVKWKGGLMAEGTLYRGHLNSNVNYSMGISKRRIGAFAVKGWVAGFSTLRNLP